MDKYVYPKFSEIELPGIRVAGPGLGNLLFIYSRAIVFAKKENRKMIYPTWTSFRIGPWLRHERDKRLYNNLFRNTSGSVSGVRKWLLLWTQPKSEYDHQKENNEKITVFSYNHMKMDFSDLTDYYSDIYSTLIRELQPQNYTIVKNKERVVSVHVRLGDFAMNNTELLKQGVNNIRTSIEWYLRILTQIQDQVENIEFHIFSDGSDEELKEILALKNTKRVFYGSSIADIFAMAQSKLIVSSGSSFSLWARFLGQSCCISAPGQMKCSALCKNSESFEVEYDDCDALSIDYIYKIKSLYGDSE